MALAIRISSAFRAPLARSTRSTPLKASRTWKRTISSRLPLNSCQRQFQVLKTRGYCTYHNEKAPIIEKKVEEVEEMEVDLGEEEIPLVESHWDSYVQELTATLKQKLDARDIEIHDITKPNCGTTIEIRLASPKFASCSKVDQVRLVTNALTGLLDDVHAITVKTKVIGQ